MAEIVEAVKDQNVATLKSMFTEYARAEYSDEIDEGLAYLLSMFPDGDIIWENPEYRPNVREAYDSGERTTVVPAIFQVSSGGRPYWLFFSYYTLNTIDPGNVGVYGIGVAPRTERRDSGPEQVFFLWEASVSGLRDNGPPGVYIPTYDNADLADLMMKQIVEDLNIQDPLGLREEVFTEYAQTQHPTAIDDELDALMALFPAGDVAWEEFPEDPVVRLASNGDDETILLLPLYPISSGGADYWLFFASFTVNTIDPDNLGLYAIGVAPRTESRDSPQEQALFAWADTFDVDATTPAGIFIAK